MATLIEKRRMAAAKRILKGIDDYNEKCKTKIIRPTGYWLNNNCQFIVNGYVGASIFDGHYVSGIPQTKDNVPVVDTFYGIIDSTLQKDTYEITSFVPSVQYLKAYEKEYRSKTKNSRSFVGSPIFIGDDFVNTKHLIDIMQLLPDSKFFVNPERLLAPILLKSEYGNGILLPIRPFGAINGEKEFYNKYPFANSPKNKINVFHNQTYERRL